MDSVKEVINKIIKRVNLLENDLGTHTGQIDRLRSQMDKIFAPDPSHQYPNALLPPAKVLSGEIDKLRQENKVLQSLVAAGKQHEEQRVKDDTELRKSYTLVHNNLLKVLQNEAMWGKSSMDRLFQIATSPTYTTPSEYRITIIDLWNHNPSLRSGQTLSPHAYYPRDAANTAKSYPL